MSIWIAVIIVLISRVIIGTCSYIISEKGYDSSKLMFDAHAIELFVVYIAIIALLKIHIVDLVLFWFMVACVIWGVVQLIGLSALFKAHRQVAVYWTIARAVGVIAMSVTIYWAYTFIWK